ncbi:hypothetical protein KQX54_007139 [Cotesia glomerata]|uniref:Uncharacterized protein n=1 Tax=Cotesia glomerata TaxID=32391 RepID=A0AAV7I392_COTGL|nr:hypothetical protein KQX54_007139 [Cotesia glomerata]
MREVFRGRKKKAELKDESQETRVRGLRNLSIASEIETVALVANCGPITGQVGALRCLQSRSKAAIKPLWYKVRGSVFVFVFSQLIAVLRLVVELKRPKGKIKQRTV